MVRLFGIAIGAVFCVVLLFAALSPREATEVDPTLAFHEHPNPSELLGSERMSQTLKELEECFDLVIIDTPPMVVSDTQILSGKVGGVIFVVIPGQTRAITALRPMEELRRIGSHVLGVVANKIPKSRDYYYGGYNYYSPYNSNHYSYHNETVQPAAENESDEQPGTPLISIFNKNRRKD